MSEQRIIETIKNRNELNDRTDDEIKAAYKETIVWAGLGFHFALIDFGNSVKNALIRKGK